MGTDGANDEVGDSTELDFVTVGKAIFLLRIFGIYCVYEYLCVILISHVGEICVVSSVIPLGEGMALLSRHCDVVYQVVKLFGDPRIEESCPAHERLCVCSDRTN